MFFGGAGPPGGSRASTVRKSKPIIHKLGVTLEELYKGKTRKLAANRDVCCSECDGKGGKKVEQCSPCKGRGMKIFTKQIGPGMMQQIQSACDACSATGEIISEASKCKVCKGKKTTRDKKILEVCIYSYPIQYGIDILSTYRFT